MAVDIASHPVSLIRLLCMFFTVHRLLPAAQAIWMTIPSSGTRCVSEEIQSNVVVLGDYLLVDAQGEVDSGHHAPPISTISAKVTSPYGNPLHHTENVTHGQFAFTTSEGGNHMACFWLHSNHHGGKDVTLNLEWKIGIAAKDWESVARKEKIDGIELELAKLEGILEAIHQNMLYLKSMEVEMREVSEKTNGRVAWLSVMSLGACITAAFWQTWHLQGFFQKKKLI